MVLLVERIAKLYSKLENHHHHHNHHHHDDQQSEEALSASLKAFRSHVSSCLTQLLLNLKPVDLETLSLEWIQLCFQVLPMINKAFAKLVVEIDYSMSKWKGKTREEYLNYTVDLLDLLNSFSSSLSQLGQARISLSHALSLVETSSFSAIERLKVSEFKIIRKKFKDQENKEDEKERSCSGKEWVVLQALMEVRSIRFWVCNVVLAGLCGDADVYLEMRKSGVELSNPALINLDSRICGVVMDKGCVLKEVTELNYAAAGLAAAIGGKNSSDAAEDMQRKLRVFEKLLDGFMKEVDLLFSEVLGGRHKLLNEIRIPKP